jgi:hypothetical protein
MTSVRPAVNGNRRSIQLSCRTGELVVGAGAPIFYEQPSQVAVLIDASGIAFDDHATKAMGEAFEAACRALHDTGRPQIVYDVIAKRII